MKTTKKHFELFQKEAAKWIEYLGLKGWRVTFRHYYLSGSRAEIHSDSLADRSVSIFLSTDWGNDLVTDSNIKRSAFHEVCELLLLRIYSMAVDRDSTESQVTEESHNIIRTLENTVFKDLKI
jgi:hypothetical protein